MSRTARAKVITPSAALFRRDVPPSAVFGWLALGWKDLWRSPGPSLLYGLAVFAVSIGVIWGLFQLDLDYVLLPALAGFMVVGSFLALGLYEKSRDLTVGIPVSFGRVFFVKPASGPQVWFTGVILCGLMLLWMRAAVIIYALFFGVRPFPGFDHVLGMLFTTPIGWTMLGVGAAVGGLFAAFAFAISVFAIPMLLDEKVDAFTAMGTSLSLVWANLPVMLIWAVIVLALFLICVATGLLGLIVIYPWLGHAAWHSYRAIR